MTKKQTLRMIGFGTLATGLVGLAAWAQNLNVDGTSTLKGNTYLSTVSGNVGIGNSAPTKKLDVTGGIKGTELCIAADCRTSWPGGGTYVTLSADVTNATTTFANVTGLSFAVAASTKYDVECSIAYTANATTTGLGLSWTGPASPTQASAMVIGATSTTAATVATLTGNDTGTVWTASAALSPTLNHATLTGHWSNGTTAGTLQLRVKSEVAVASGIVIKAGSWCKYSAY